jgi:hypothetical protein
VDVIGVPLLANLLQVFLELLRLHEIPDLLPQYG